MKLKYLTIALASLALCFNAGAQDFRLGGKIDVSGNWITGAMVERGTRVLPHTGISGGITAEYEFDDNFVIAAEVIYSGKGYSDITDIINTDLSKSSLLYRMDCGYLQVPLLFGYKVDEAGKCTLSIGPEFGYLLHAKQYTRANNQKGNVTNIKEWFKPFSCSLALQARYMFLENLGIEIKFDWGLTRCFKDQFYKELFLKNNTHNIGVQLGLVFNFEL